VVSGSIIENDVSNLRLHDIARKLYRVAMQQLLGVFVRPEVSVRVESHLQREWV
jgi:hypothetical protein